MAELKALIFDVDGTLADTEEIHRRAFNDIFAAHDLAWNWTRADYAKLLKVTGGKERIAHFMRDWLGRDPQEIDIPALHREKTDRYVALVESGELKLRPGVERLINEALSADVKVAIATTTSLENVQVLVEQTLGAAMIGAFAVISAGDMVKAKKPAPDIYFHALEAMRLNPQEAIALEDSSNGLQSSLAAGVSCLITTNPYTEDQEFPGALAVLKSLDEPGEAVTLNWLRRRADQRS